MKKVGSDRNGHRVIYMSGYMPGYYQPENDDVMGKSSVVTVGYVYVMVAEWDNFIGDK